MLHPYSMDIKGCPQTPSDTSCESDKPLTSFQYVTSHVILQALTIMALGHCSTIDHILQRKTGSTTRPYRSTHWHSDSPEMYHHVIMFTLGMVVTTSHGTMWKHRMYGDRSTWAMDLTGLMEMLRGGYLGLFNVVTFMYIRQSDNYSILHTLSFMLPDPSPHL